MHYKGKFNNLKHFDFILIDSLMLVVSFMITLLWNKEICFDENFRFTVYTSVLLSIVVNTFNNTYSGILKRTFFYDLSSDLISSIFIFILIFLSGKLLCLSLSGKLLFITWLVFFFLSLIAKNIWKMAIVGQKIIFGKRKPNALIAVVDKNNLDFIVHSIKRQDIFLYNLVGICCVDKTEITEIEGVPVFSKKDIIKKCLSLNAEEILVCVPAYKIKENIYEQLRKNDIVINFELESLLGFKPEDQHISKVSLYKTLTIDNNTVTLKKIVFFVFKRLIDIVSGLIGTLICLPIAAIVKIAYLGNGDKKSILFKQKRIGKKGKTIEIYKFRTMVYNAEEILQEMLKDPRYKEEWDKNQKFENDPRITPIGKILRRTSLDEFPQFINVLKGEMSLIGPRPLVENELTDHGGFKLYQRLKPGITGWWGCNGRSNLDYESRLELEYYYIQNCSISLDLLIIIKTITSIMKKEGAK